MRIANVRGRLTLLAGDRGIDVETASKGRFAADPAGGVRTSGPRSATWAARRPTRRGAPVADADLGAPAPRPAQVFGIGLNYRDHAAESGLPLPDRPATFTKFPTCLTGPFADVPLPTRDGRLGGRAGGGDRRPQAHRVAEDAAGVTSPASPSARTSPSASCSGRGGGQFSLGKSFPGFGPMGPCLVTPDELARSRRPRARLQRRTAR